MSRTLVIPDQLYARLAAEARSEGLAGVEDLLQKLVGALPRRARRGQVEQVRAVHERLRHKYGELPDSTPLIREDRSR